MLAVRPLAAADVAAVTRIFRGLPDYFTSDVPGQVARDTEDHDGWVLTDSGGRLRCGGPQICGRGRDLVDGGRSGAPRHRLGTVLLERMLGELAADGVSVVQAKTLDRSASYQPYEATRAFWEHRGFVQVGMIDRSRGGNRATPRPST